MFLTDTAGKNIWRCQTLIRRAVIKTRRSTLTFTQVLVPEFIVVFALVVTIVIISLSLTASHTFCPTDGAECNVQLMKPGQSVAARLLAVIEDLEQAHATFQRREKEDATSVILNP